MRYTYDVIDSLGNVVHKNLSSEEEARTVLAMMQEQGVNTSDYTIKETQHYTVTGLGRDPDLH